MDTNDIFSFILDNAKKIFYPEEWLALDFEFSKSELFALILVDRYGEITMSQVADYIHVPMSTATGVVERLVRNGYLKRERSESDRRIVTIILTDRGKKVVEQIKGTAFKYIQLLNEELTEEERQVLFRIVTKVINVLGKNDTENEEKVEINRPKKIDIE